MQSEFHHVALDQLRYSLVWEDHRTLHEALAPQPDDRALVVTSAGCNVLNTLLAGPPRVTAIDLNPVQNELLRLKCHAIAQHPPAVLRGLMGFAGPAAVAAAWRTLAPTLPAERRAFWASFFESHPAGLATAGRLERYLTNFLPTLDAATQARLRQLAARGTLAGQVEFFGRELDGTDFETQFVRYFDDANLSQGRDPRLFRYASESGGRAFYRRLRDFLHRTLARDSFYFRFFFFGPEALPEAILPPCYQARNHERLRARLDRLEIVTGEAVDFLQSAAGQSVTKASLSNIFEYVSPEEFRRVGGGLAARPGSPVRAVFWNLLQDQGADQSLLLDEAASARLSAQEGCFYFRNVRVLDVRRVPQPVQPDHERA